MRLENGMRKKRKKRRREAVNVGPAACVEGWDFPLTRRGEWATGAKKGLAPIKERGKSWL